MSLVPQSSISDYLNFKTWPCHFGVSHQQLPLSIEYITNLSPSNSIQSRLPFQVSPYFMSTQTLSYSQADLGSAIGTAQWSPCPPQPLPKHIQLQLQVSLSCFTEPALTPWTLRSIPNSEEHCFLPLSLHVDRLSVLPHFSFAVSGAQTGPKTMEGRACVWGPWQPFSPVLEQ